MNRGTLLVIGLAAAGMLLAGCGAQAASDPERPSVTVPDKGTSMSRITLTAQAAQRIGLQTLPVQPVASTSDGVTESVPLAAIVYLSDGSTWVYAVMGNLTYERQKVSMARVAGDTAMLSSGPPPGTSVVTVGAAELLGSEYGVAGGQ
jgi:hypothetical protein